VCHFLQVGVVTLALFDSRGRLSFSLLSCSLLCDKVKRQKKKKKKIRDFLTQYSRLILWKNLTDVQDEVSPPRRQTTLESLCPGNISSPIPWGSPCQRASVTSCHKPKSPNTQKGSLLSVRRTFPKCGSGVLAGQVSYWKLNIF
jgi:hypothetical protein